MRRASVQTGVLLFSIVGLVSQVSMSYGQLTVDTSVNAIGCVQDVLTGEGVVVDNVTFGGNEETQIGLFNCNNCGIGIGSGVIMGSGNVMGAVGPNGSGSHSLGPPTGSDGFGDADLAALANNPNINNAAILNFDFIPTGDSLAFNFVFGSEEYPEYVNSINDAFGFFISGPGISGPFQNNAKNIALIPNTSTPVTINTVNHLINTIHYTSNTPAQYDVQADGFTKVLTAQTSVICGETYHIKIAIGDASDGGWDSWVFLEGGSFQSNQVGLAFEQPELAPSISNGIYEGCGSGGLTFARPPSVTGDFSFDIIYSGTAQNGVDVELLPTTIVIPEGEDSYTLSITPINDGIQEPTETIVISPQIEDNCGNMVEITVYIYDPPGLAVSISPSDTDVCPDEEVVLTTMVENTVGGVSYSWSTGITSASATVSSPNTASYSVTVTDGCYSVTGEYTMNVHPLLSPLTVPEHDFTLCIGSTSGVIIQGGIQPYIIEYDDEMLVYENDEFANIVLSGITEVVVTDYCHNTDTFNILISACDTDIPNIFTPDGNGANDTFEIGGISEFPKSTLLIYNRWGNLIFESNDYRNEWSGKEEEDGIYFYIFRRSDGAEYTGNVTIVRR